MLAIVTPIYEDSEAATRLFRELRDALGTELFIVAVDDGSLRQVISPEAIAAAGLPGVVLRLKRNVGHQRAVAAGIAYVAERLPEARCVVMDSDGEDVPATIPDLVAGLDSPDVEVVVAHRRSRVETLQFKAAYQLYRLLFRFLTGRAISFGNFMALKPVAVRRLSVMQELGTHLAASVLASRLRMVLCPLDRGARYAGRSKMNFTGLVLHGCRALMIFTEDVLLRTCMLCGAVAVLSVALMLISVILKALDMATPGWFSVALGILLLVLMQTGALTLMTLMLTGVVRGINPIAPDYRQLIGEVLEVPA